MELHLIINSLSIGCRTEKSLYLLRKAICQATVFGSCTIWIKTIPRDNSIKPAIQPTDLVIKIVRGVEHISLRILMEVDLKFGFGLIFQSKEN